MKTAICHYSFHRIWQEENWTCMQLAENIKGFGVDGVDFHAGLLGTQEGKIDEIKKALSCTGLVLSGFSLSNNFNISDPDKLRSEINNTVNWMQFAAELKAPVSRIFGGYIENRQDQNELDSGFQRIIDALGQVTQEAEKLGLILALENHGGLPCTGEEQVKVIKTINSPHLRATVDVGNYMQCHQEAHVGSEIAASVASYVHFKDYKKIPDDNSPMGYKLQPCIIGRGDVDHKKCIQALTNAGYNGFIALEFEGPEHEMSAVPESISFMKNILG